MTLQQHLSDQIRDSIAANGGLLLVPDVARQLGVSRERARVIIRDHADFPAPVAHVTVNGSREPVPAWLGSDVDSWNRRRKERLKKRRQRGTRTDRMRGPRT